MILLLAALAVLSPAAARTLMVGPGHPYALPSEAAHDAEGGDTIRIQPGTYADCAVLTADDLVIEGAGDAADTWLTSRPCAGKGLLVTRGNRITVRNLTLAYAHVPDGNGAGIRNEAPDLTVENVRFLENENGILSTPATPGTILVRNSLFDRNGTCANPGGCAHGLYAGPSLLLRVENSTFTATRDGHHIKSRGLRTEIVGCTIQDGPQGTASYLVEQPNGGTLLMRANVLEKGPRSANRTGIMVGSEAATNPTRAIAIEGNLFRNDAGYSATFVVNRTSTAAELRNNRLLGPVRPLAGPGQVVQ